MFIKRKVLVKVFGLILFVITLLILLRNLFEESKLSVTLTDDHPFATPDVSIINDYERQVVEDEYRIVPWMGQNGSEVTMLDDAKLGEISLKKNAINVYISDQIAYNRTLMDNRDPKCREVIYDAELPSASVILIFHNEPYSVILRTVWSILNSCKRTNKWFKLAGNIDRMENILRLGYLGQDPNSKYVYLKEIILIDDNSTMPELKGKLSYYIETRLPTDLVKLIRLSDRKGLTHARMAGAKIARGNVLIYMDAHCEVGTDWLRPLLQHIADYRNSVVTPIIEIIDEYTFELQRVNEHQVAGFNFNGNFLWISVSDNEMERRRSNIDPVRSPVMAGGLFAIDRSYFWKLGGYDEQMTGWGGENLEMSFRVWMCGGTIEMLPCSRVGHIFRSFTPYQKSNSSDSFGVNMARTAEVWMDEYKELFYLFRLDLRNNAVVGDLSDRKMLREKLNCKSYEWYLNQVYPDKFVPIKTDRAWGRIINMEASHKYCLNRYTSPGSPDTVLVFHCYAVLKPSQFWSLTTENRIRSENDCLDLPRLTINFTNVFLTVASCQSNVRKRQQFRIMMEDRLQHIESGLCIDANQPGENVRLLKCDVDSLTQKWKFDFTEDSPIVGPLFQSKSHIAAVERFRKTKR